MLFMEAKDQNSLIVLPTGLGKTIIILYLVGYYYQKYPNKKILIATPTKPLVHQIAQTFLEYLEVPEEIIFEMAGSTSPDKRATMYQNGQIFIGTPQTFSNDFDTDKIDPKDISLLCFDEAHRSTGNYAYVKIVQNFYDFNLNPRIIGFTATPGNKPEQIEQVIQNLHIESISSRFADDPDVRSYVSQHRPKIIWVQLPDSYKTILKFFEEYQNEIIAKIEEKGLEPGKYITKRVALDLQKQVTALMEDDPEIGELLYYVPNLIRILHIKEMTETQGLPQAKTTLSKWFLDPKQKTLKMFIEHPFIKNAYEIISQNNEKHPKLIKLIEILKERTQDPESKIIVFTNYRDSVDFLLKELEEQNIVAKKFIGQSSQKKSSGMSQKDQIAVLDEFKNSDLNVLISTSVGEEGIDVGACDLVIFYDSVSSVVRNVQRVGRGRKRQSEVIRLITRDTKDAIMYYATLKQERKIQDFIRRELPKKVNIEIKPVKIIQKRPVSLQSQMASIDQNSSGQTSLYQYMSKEKNTEATKTTPVNTPETQQKYSSPTIQKNKLKDVPTEKEDESQTFTTEKDKILILVDNREARSQVPRLLKRSENTKIQLVNLPEGDYKVSGECVIERKSMHDFAESIIDGRLFDQIGNKLSTYKKPILLLEGMETDIKINIARSAIKGAIASIALSYKIPILRTVSESDTADMILALARREQRNDKNKPTLITISKSYPMKEIQRFILASIPGVNRTKADQLIEEFKTIQKLANADPDELVKIEGIGKTLTERILKILQDEASDTDHIE